MISPTKRQMIGWPVPIVTTILLPAHAQTTEHVPSVLFGNKTVQGYTFYFSARLSGDAPSMGVFVIGTPIISGSLVNALVDDFGDFFSTNENGHGVRGNVTGHQATFDYLTHDGQRFNVSINLTASE